MLPPQILIYGCGSIGLRHAQIAHDFGAKVIAVSSQKKLPFTTVNNLIDIPKNTKFTLAIIATPTHLHARNLQELNSIATERILIEKPLFSSLEKTISHTTAIKTKDIFVAYNLRFHPAINELKKILQNKKLLAMQMHVGQYLPSWRPSQDYSQSYSAHKEQGGGVLRDLSHELDLACFFGGKWKRVTALGGKVSELKINSDDCMSILAEHAHCPQVSIHLDYLQTPARRDIVFVCENHSIHFNLITHEVTQGNSVSKFTVDRNTTYKAQMAALLSDSTANACSYNQGLDIVNYITAIEKAIEGNTWVWNNNL